LSSQSLFINARRTSAQSIFILTLLLLVGIQAPAYSQVLHSQKLVGNWALPKSNLGMIELTLWHDTRWSQDFRSVGVLQGVISFAKQPQCNTNVAFPLRQNDLWVARKVGEKKDIDSRNRAFKLMIPKSVGRYRKNDEDHAQAKKCKRIWEFLHLKSFVAPVKMTGNMSIIMGFKLVELTRVKPSDAQNQMIKEYSGGKPTAVELAIIQKPQNVTADTLTKVPATCAMYFGELADIKVQIKKVFPFDLLHIESSPQQDILVGTKRGRSGRGPTEYRQPLPSNVNIKNLQYDIYKYGNIYEHPDKTDCETIKNAFMLTSLISDKKVDLSQLVVNLPSQIDKEQKLKDLTRFYLVDSSGVDQIPFNGTDFKQSVAIRVYGKTNAYNPSDRTRYTIWDSKQQKLLIRNTMKNTETGNITRDIEGGATNTTFKFSKNTSQQHSHPVWQSSRYQVIDKSGNTQPNQALCIEWVAGKNDATEKCLRKSPLAANKMRMMYLTQSEKVAIALFNELAPQTTINANQLTKRCENKELCNLPGGEYLDAMLRTDTATISKLDAQYLGKLQTFMNNNPLKELVEATGGKMNMNMSMSNAAIKEYLFNYQNNDRECMAGTSTYTAHGSSDTVLEVDSFGNSRVIAEGRNYTEHFKIPSDLLGLCQEVCEVRAMSHASFNEHEVLRGVRKMQETFKCDSALIKQFEKSMGQLRSIRNQGPILQRNTV